MDIDKEISFFDQFEKEHGDYDVLAEESYERILGALFRGMPSARTRRASIWGAGPAPLPDVCSKLELKLTGVDISPRSIERARAIGGGPRVRRRRYLRLSAAVRLI